MPLNLRASQNISSFNVPVSYKIYDRSGKLLDARNVQSVQNRLETRYGTSRFNTVPLDGSIKSLSYFTKSDGSQYTIAKAGTNLWSVSQTGAHTLIKGGLSEHTKHRGVTWNDRHIFSIESDGLYSWDGERFGQLGIQPPYDLGYTANAGGTLVIGNRYRVGITFYSSFLGAESNIYDNDNTGEITIVDPNRSIAVDEFPPASPNQFIDKIYIYLKDLTLDSDYLFVGEVDLDPEGIPIFIISEPPTSTQTPPTQNGMPNAGGGKGLTFFNSKFVYYGSSQYTNEVYFSLPDQPDAFDPFDTQETLVIPGKGGVTGVSVGLYNDSVLDPYLVIFKRKSTRIYSEIGNEKRMVVLSEDIGCVSNETIQVKNGNVYFLSEEGWRAISNGRFIVSDQGEAVTLGTGDIDDIFKSTGFEYEVNRLGLANAFSVYYPTLDQYITWVSEGSNAAYTKAYSYEFDVAGFKPYEFSMPATCTTLGEDTEGRDIVLIGNSDGYILKHSIMEERSDVDADNNKVAINAFAVLPWIPKEADFDATYNYRELILRAVSSEHALTVKTFLDFNLATADERSYDFTSPIDGFVLDSSILDVDTFGDERGIVTSRSDINRVGESIAIGFYQNIENANIGLVSMQIDQSKNGNRNSSNDNGDEEGGFDYESGTYYPSVSESVKLAQYYAEQAALSAASAAAALPPGGDPGDFIERDTPTTTVWKDGSFVGYSARFNENFSSDGLHDTLAKILNLQYAAPLISLSASPAQSVREKGVEITSVDLTANTTKRTDPITEVTFYRGAALIHTVPSPDPDGATNEDYTDVFSFSDTISYSAKVSDDTTETTSNIVTYTFVYPYYYGTGAPHLSAADVADLTKDVITSNANLNKAFTTTNEQVYYFAYPASYGALTSILDENGFETIGDWTLRTENITGLNGTPVSYRIYEFNNPVVAGSTDYTFKR